MSMAALAMGLVVRGEAFRHYIDGVLSRTRHGRQRLIELQQFRVKCFSHVLVPSLAETARNVVLCPLVLRDGEELGGISIFDKLAQQEEGALVGDTVACCMLWVTITIV